jgi:hypothetical protein
MVIRILVVVFGGEKFSLDENFAWSLAATTSAAVGGGEGALPGT